VEKLTFIGGTCLRMCYGSSRLSEDLDFSAGKNFNKESLKELPELLTGKLFVKYGLTVEVSEPKRGWRQCRYLENSDCNATAGENGAHPAYQYRCLSLLVIERGQHQWSAPDKRPNLGVALGYGHLCKPTPNQ
jgi:hypothetical protein